MICRCSDRQRGRAHEFLVIQVHVYLKCCAGIMAGRAAAQPSGAVVPPYDALRRHGEFCRTDSTDLPCQSCLQKNSLSLTPKYLYIPAVPFPLQGRIAIVDGRRDGMR